MSMSPRAGSAEIDFFFQAKAKPCVTLKVTVLRGRNITDGWWDHSEYGLSLPSWRRVRRNAKPERDKLETSEGYSNMWIVLCLSNKTVLCVLHIWCEVCTVHNSAFGLRCFMKSINCPSTVFFFFVISLTELPRSRWHALCYYFTFRFVAVSRPDPYVVLAVPTAAEKQKKTKTVDNSRSPEWNETFTFHYDSSTKNNALRKWRTSQRTKAKPKSPQSREHNAWIYPNVKGNIELAITTTDTAVELGLEA